MASTYWRLMNTALRCPGQDTRFWQEKDIREVQCPYCASTIEFWRDDPMRYCSNCGEIVSNPQINLSCAKWCKMAKECLGDLPEEAIAASPVIERLKALLHKRLAAAPDRMQNALDTLLKAETMMMKEEGDPSLVKPSSLFAGALLTPAGDVDDGADTTAMRRLGMRCWSNREWRPPAPGMPLSLWRRLPLPAIGRKMEISPSFGTQPNCKS